MTKLYIYLYMYICTCVSVYIYTSPLNHEHTFLKCKIKHYQAKALKILKG